MEIPVDERQRRAAILDYVDGSGTVMWHPRRFWLGIGLEALGLALTGYFLYWVVDNTGKTFPNDANSALTLWKAFAPILAAMSGGLLIFFGRPMRKFDARTALVRSAVPPILYLRAFKEDTNFKSRNPIFEDGLSERRLVKLVRPLGPLICIGEPSGLRRSGAVRFFVSSNNWTEVVLFLMRHCNVTLIRLAPTEGLLTELQLASRWCHPTRLLLLVDRSARWVNKVRAEGYDIVAVASEALGVPLSVDIRVQYIWFTKNWEPRFIRSANDWYAYLDAAPWRS